MVVKQRQRLPYQDNITSALFCLRYDEQLGRITSIGRSLGGSRRHVHLRSSLNSLLISAVTPCIDHHVNEWGQQISVVYILHQ
jgi:hypothetical protein